MKIFPSLSTQEFSKIRYNRLLSVLIALMILSPFLDQGIIGSILMSALFFITICQIVYTFNLEASSFRIYILIAVLSLLCNIASHFILFESAAKNLILFKACIDSLFIGLAIIIISRRIFHSKKVTADTIKGGICIYLLIGLLWAILYYAVLIINPESFSHTTQDSQQSFEQQFVRLFYFSFTTLTTLGYGDIVPQDRISMVLANLEAIVGQMYPAILIARLVGLYSTEEIEKAIDKQD